MTSRLREIAAKNADLSDQGRSGPAGTPTTAANGQGAGGEYKPLRPLVKGAGATINPSPFRGGK